MVPDRVLTLFPLQALIPKALRVIRKEEGTRSTHYALLLSDYKSRGLTAFQSNSCQYHKGFGRPLSLGDNC